MSFTFERGCFLGPHLKGREFEKEELGGFESNDFMDGLFDREGYALLPLFDL